MQSDPALKLSIVRCLLRELLMVCVLRPLIMLFWPGSIYRVGVGADAGVGVCRCGCVRRCLLRALAAGAALLTWCVSCGLSSYAPSAGRPTHGWVVRALSPP